MTETVCFRCDHVYVVAGDVPDMWVCDTCREREADEADGGKLARYWSGGLKWAAQAREAEARKVKR